ncbi:hypothetical protein C0J52_11771 [Blattella germanica]|nr:hypothetical protein C0J52_11771 [Blattella germanica]
MNLAQFYVPSSSCVKIPHDVYASEDSTLSDDDTAIDNVLASDSGDHSSRVRQMPLGNTNTDEDNEDDVPL